MNDFELTVADLYSNLYFQSTFTPNWSHCTKINSFVQGFWSCSPVFTVIAGSLEAALFIEIGHPGDLGKGWGGPWHFYDK